MELRPKRLAGLVFRSLVVASFLVATPAQAQTPPPDGYSAVSVNEARLMGMEAIRRGRPDIAAEIAMLLLQKDKTDSFAHFLMASSLMRLKRPKDAEAAAKQSYRFAKTPEQSYQSAHLAADLAFRRGALTTAQWWLRKSAEAAPDAKRKDVSVAQFHAVKARNPWRIKLAFSVRPSDNVNNGSSDQFNIIDGLPFVGSLSADAQAVKGVIGEAAISLGYRLRHTGHSSTSVGAEISTRRVHLSASEKARLGGDPGFGSDRFSVSLRQDWRPKHSKHRFSLEGEIGRQAYQSASDYSFWGLTLGHRFALSPNALIDSALEGEQRSKQSGTRGDRSFGIRSTLVFQRGNEDLITASLLANRYDTTLDGRSSTMFGTQLGYTLAKPIGQIGISGKIGLQTTKYNDYTLATIVVPGGRTDTTGYAELQLQFNKASYAGFAPQLRLRHLRTHSNVSRFETKETSITLGIASKF